MFSRFAQGFSRFVQKGTSVFAFSSGNSLVNRGFRQVGRGLQGYANWSREVGREMGTIGTSTVIGAGMGMAIGENKDFGSLLNNAAIGGAAGGALGAGIRHLGPRLRSNRPVQMNLPGIS